MRIYLSTVALAFALSLAACDRGSERVAAPAPAASPAGIEGVKPAAEEHAASSTGASDGAAAIGGLAGGAGTGAHPAPPRGNVPAPTGGDGAAPAASY